MSPLRLVVVKDIVPLDWGSRDELIAATDRMIQEGRAPMDIVSVEPKKTMKVRMTIELEVALIEGDERKEFFESALPEEDQNEDIEAVDIARREESGEITWETAQPGDFFDPSEFGERVCYVLATDEGNTMMFEGTDSPLKIVGAKPLTCVALAAGA